MEYSNLRVPAMVNRLSNSTQRETRPSFPKLNYHSNEIHTHNNNQPFSYTRTTPGQQSQQQQQQQYNTRTTERNMNSYSLDRKNFNKPNKEVIYAQVVVSDTDENGGTGTGRNGVHKRTVHTTFNGHSNSHTRDHTPHDHLNIHTEPRSSNHHHHHHHRHVTSSPGTTTHDPDIIEHYVYKRSSNKENLRNKYNNNNNNPLLDLSSSSYSTFDTYKPKNITTVLINNNDDDEYNIKSAASRTNELFSNYRSSSTPPPEQHHRSYFYGGDTTTTIKTNHNNNVQNSNSSSSPPYYQFDSSRSVSPAIITKNVTSAKLVREANKNRDSTFISSAKLVNTFGPYTTITTNNGGHQTHTGYSYMTNKLGSMSSLEGTKETTTKINDFHQNQSSHNNNDHQHQQRHVYKQQYKHKYTPGEDSDIDIIDMKLLTTSPEKYTTNHRNNKSKTPPKNNFSNHTNSLENIYNSKHSTSRHSLDSKTITTLTTTTTTGEKEKEKEKEKKNGKKNENSSSGGIISTLLRRNKDKKQENNIIKKNINNNNNNNNNNKEDKKIPELKIKDEDKEKEGKIKRQRAKFLSVFLEKNFTSKNKKDDKLLVDDKNKTNDILSSSTSNGNKHIMNDNNSKRITDSEIEEVERRRDGEYHSWSSGDDFYRFQSKGGQSNNHRDHSYNFGEYKKESDISGYDHHDDIDYRRNLATTPRYTSVTLGRPTGHPKKSEDYNDSIEFRSKSLDRGALRNKKNIIPEIIVTPNSPPIQTTDKWNSSYEINNTKHNNNNNNNSDWSRKEFSKSTIELGGSGQQQQQQQQQNDNLRYFGDTDIEDISNYGRRREIPSYNNSTLNSHPSTTNKMQSQYQNGYIVRNGKHISRKDNIPIRFQKINGPTMTRNSSESDNERSGSSQRSVYLHAPAVASIPTTLPKRTLSRDEISNHSGHQKQTRHLARSMSVLSPWRPRHYAEKYELNYNSNGVRSDSVSSKPPRLPRSPVQKSISPSPGRDKQDSKNQTTEIIKSKQTITKDKNSSKNNVSRTKSIPKNSRLGWFTRKKHGGGGGTTTGETGAVK